MKRLSLRSMAAARSISGTPATRLRSPSSSYSGTKRIPARPSRRDADTVSRSLPRHETTPIPVTTTRRISETLGGRKQAHAQVGGQVDLAPVDQGAAVGDHQVQAAAHGAADVHLVAHQLRVRKHLAAELDLPHAQRAAAAGGAQPGQVEAAQLPHGVQPQAAGHDRITLEVAVEEPQVRADVELGPDLALAVPATLGGDVGDAVE